MGIRISAVLLAHVVGAEDHQRGRDELGQIADGETAADDAGDIANQSDGQRDAGEYEHGLDLAGVLSGAHAEDAADQREHTGHDQSDDKTRHSGGGGSVARLLGDGVCADAASTEGAEQTDDDLGGTADDIQDADNVDVLLRIAHKIVPPIFAWSLFTAACFFIYTNPSVPYA